MTDKVPGTFTCTHCFLAPSPTPLQYLVLLLHASACWFYWVARIKGFSDDTWLANNFDLVASQNITTQYIYCLYFCVTTFATVGYGDIHAYTIPEVMLIMVLMMINMVSTPCTILL
jgi:hypothetical protein